MVIQYTAIYGCWGRQAADDDGAARRLSYIVLTWQRRSNRVESWRRYVYRSDKKIGFLRYICSWPFPLAHGATGSANLCMLFTFVRFTVASDVSSSTLSGKHQNITKWGSCHVVPLYVWRWSASTGETRMPCQHSQTWWPGIFDSIWSSFESSVVSSWIFPEILSYSEDRFLCHHRSLPRHNGSTSEYLGRSGRDFFCGTASSHWFIHTLFFSSVSYNDFIFA